MKVRNACPFPVTFYALAGPTLELPASTTQTAKACLIWFSTRVKGGGDVFNLDDWERYKEEYLKEYEKHAGQVGDQSGSGTGEVAGSILGYSLDSLVEVFAVKNTRKGDDTYFGAKKEGVYGSSDLVVYATLDVACQQDPDMGKIWYLHLETDKGQQSDTQNADPSYTRPDLSAYGDRFFFTLQNCSTGTYLYSETDDYTVGVQPARAPGAIPFNPRTMREYWSVSPVDAGDITHNVKILNTATNKWLTCFSSAGNKVGLVSFNYTDYRDQHWSLSEVGQAPETIRMKNAEIGQNLVGAPDGHTFMYNPIDSYWNDQSWLVKTYTSDIHNIPSDKFFRIMHAQTGLYMGYRDAPGDGYEVVMLNHSGNPVDGGKSATFLHVNPQRVSDGVYKLICIASGYYLTFYGDDRRLNFYPSQYADYPDQHWRIEIESHHAGFYLKNQGPAFAGSENLYYKSNNFGLFGGGYDDQLWVAVLE